MMIWKEVIVANFEVVFQFVPGGTEEYYKIFSQNLPVSG
jgi:hypothetical protein